MKVHFFQKHPFLSNKKKMDEKNDSLISNELISNVKDFFDNRFSKLYVQYSPNSNEVGLTRKIGFQILDLLPNFVNDLMKPYEEIRKKLNDMQMNYYAWIQYFTTLKITMELHNEKIKKIITLIQEVLELLTNYKSEKQVQIETMIEHIMEVIPSKYKNQSILNNDINIFDNRVKYIKYFTKLYMSIYISHD